MSVTCWRIATVVSFAFHNAVLNDNFLAFSGPLQVLDKKGLKYFRSLKKMRLI